MMPKSIKIVFLPYLLIFCCFIEEALAQEALEPIVVRRAPYGSAANGPVSAVLTQDDIRDMAAGSPEDVLSYLGADVQTRGPGSMKSDLSLQASTFQQVLVLVNGVRVKDAQTSHHDLDLYFNVEDIERVEVVPAAASVKYGPDGIGGAVNFVLKKPRADEKGSLAASVGNHRTFEEKMSLFYPVGGIKNRFSISDTTSDGGRPSTDYRQDTFFHSSVFETRDASFFLDAGYNEKEFGAYDFYTPGRGFNSREWTNTKSIDARGVMKAGRVTFEPRMAFREHFDKFVLRATNPALYMNHHRTDTFQAGGIVTFSFDAFELPLGADYGEERITSANLGKHKRGHWNVVVDPTYRWQDGSYVNVTLRMDDYTTFKEELTGSVSLNHALSETESFYVTLGRTMRVPTFTELYYSDPTTAGDANLKPEHALNFESGWNRSFNARVDTTISFFVRKEADTIDFTKLASTDALFVARNISRAVAFGPSFSGRWRSSEKTTWDLRYSYAEKLTDDDGKIYKYGRSFLKHMVDLGMKHIFSWGTNRIDIIMKKKPLRRAWVLVNDRVSIDVARDWQVFGEVENLLNVEFQEIEGIPSSGRLFKIGVTYTW